MPGSSRRRATHGFTLAELALALIVVLLLLGGTLIPLSIYLQSQRIDSNQRSLELIRERMLEFLVVHGRLPCPADPRSTGGVGAGLEATAKLGSGGPLDRQVCAVNPAAYPVDFYSGVVPWVTLRLPESDAWGHRYAYTVEASWAEIDPDCDPHLGVNAPRLPSCTIRPELANAIVASTRASPGAALAPTAADLVAIVISMGPNGAGGFDSNGTQRAAPPANADESLNALVVVGAAIASNRDFRSRAPSPRRAPCADDTAATGLCEFDDQTVFLPRSLALGKLLESRRLR